MMNHVKQKALCWLLAFVLLLSLLPATAIPAGAATSMPMEDPGSCTLRFTVLGDAEVIPPVTCEPGTEITLPTAEAPEDYTFLGWVTEDCSFVEALPEPVLSGSYTVTEDLALKALFQTTVTWSPITAVNGRSVTEEADPVTGEIYCGISESTGPYSPVVTIYLKASDLYPYVLEELEFYWGFRYYFKSNGQFVEDPTDFYYTVSSVTRASVSTALYTTTLDSDHAPYPGDPVKEITSPAACTEGGSFDLVVSCALCGEELYRRSYPSFGLGHAWSDWTVTDEPTCVENGEEARTCSRCGETETRSLEALGHLPGEPVEANYVAPSYDSEGGYDLLTYCQRCGVLLSTEHVSLPMLVPPPSCTLRFTVLGDAEVIPPVTCEPGTEITLPTAEAPEDYTFLGWVTEDCSFVEALPEPVLSGSYTVTEDLALKALFQTTVSWSPITSANGRTVTEETDPVTGEIYCGIRDYSDPSAPAVTVYLKAADLYPYVVEELEFYWGFRYYIKSNGQFVENMGNFSYQVTSVTRTPVSTALYTTSLNSDHAPYPGEPVKEITIPATCTEGGTFDLVVSCALCGEELYRRSYSSSGLGHDYVDVVTPPTATEQGYTTHTCSRCGDTYVDSYTDPTGSSEPIETTDLHVYNSFSVGTDMIVTFTVSKTDVEGYDHIWIEVVKHTPDGDVTYAYGAEQSEALSENETTWQVDFNHIFAKEMGVEIEARLYAADTAGQIYMSPARSTSIRDYLGSRLTAANNTTVQRVLAADLLNYGAAAQMFTGYQTDHLVNRELTDQQQAMLEEYETKELPPVEKTNTNYRPAGQANILFNSVSLDNQVVLTLTVRAGESDEVQVLMKDHETGAVVETLDTVWGGSSWAVDYTGLGADKMRVAYDFTAQINGVETGNTRTWSIEGYVGEIRNSGNSIKTAMANALLTYGDSAAAYFAAQ